METKFKLSIKPIECEAIRWTGNNFSEVKHFCFDRCTITYETCCIDDFWLLKVFDDIREKELTVPNGNYIVKIDGLFTVVGDGELSNWFTGYETKE